MCQKRVLRLLQAFTGVLQEKSSHARCFRQGNRYKLYICFGKCFLKVAEAINARKRPGKLIGYQMRSSMQNNCAVLLTKHHPLKARVLVFSLISIDYLFKDLSSSTIENFA